jgi:hypothetical protein
MFKAIQALGAVWQIVRWVLAQKRAMEANADAYLSDDRAKEFRLWLEKLAYALAHGNGNLTMLPKWARWFFSQTTLDNRIGRFGQVVLKSSKLEKNDPAVKEFPNYPAQ